MVIGQICQGFPRQCFPLYCIACVCMYVCVCIGDVTILQYTIFIATIQYNTPNKNIDILLIAIYCDILQYIATFIAFKVVNI